MSLHEDIPVLSEQQVERIVETRARPLVARSQPRRDPRVLVIVGPMGVGKSTLQRRVHNAMGPRSVSYDQDDLVTAYPNFAPAMEKYGPRAYELIHERMGPVLDRAADLVLGGSGDPAGSANTTAPDSIWSLPLYHAADLQDTVEMLRRAPRTNVELAFIAAPPFTGMRGDLERFERSMADVGYGRLSDAPTHQLAFDQTGKGLRHALQGRYADAVHVVSQDWQVLAGNRLNADGLWRRDPQELLTAYRSEVNRPLDMTESIAFDRWARNATQGLGPQARELREAAVASKRQHTTLHGVRMATLSNDAPGPRLDTVLGEARTNRASSPPRATPDSRNTPRPRPS